MADFCMPLALFAPPKGRGDTVNKDNTMSKGCLYDSLGSDCHLLRITPYRLFMPRAEGGKSIKGPPNSAKCAPPRENLPPARIHHDLFRAGPIPSSSSCCRSMATTWLPLGRPMIPSRSLFIFAFFMDQDHPNDHAGCRHQTRDTQILPGQQDGLYLQP